MNARSVLITYPHHHLRVRELGCSVCGVPAAPHHCKGGSMIDWFGSEFSPRGTRCHHFLVIPLCHNHHVGADGIEVMPVGFWENRFGTQVDHLIELRRSLTYDFWDLAGVPDPDRFSSSMSYLENFRKEKGNE